MHGRSLFGGNPFLVFILGGVGEAFGCGQKEMQRIQKHPEI
jgi:hypothetical protein